MHQALGGLAGDGERTLVCDAEWDRVPFPLPAVVLARRTGPAKTWIATRRSGPLVNDTSAPAGMYTVLPGESAGLTIQHHRSRSGEHHDGLLGGVAMGRHGSPWGEFESPHPCIGAFCEWPDPCLSARCRQWQFARPGSNRPCRRIEGLSRAGGSAGVARAARAATERTWEQCIRVGHRVDRLAPWQHASAPWRPMHPLAEPLTLPCGQVLPNRILKSAMSEIMGTPTHGPGKRLPVLYRRWAEEDRGLGHRQCDDRPPGAR